MSGAGSSPAGSSPAARARPKAMATTKADRQRAIRDLVAGGGIGSQLELVERLTGRGFVATQATVSRDIAELGLVKVPGADGHAYVAAESLGGAAGGPRGGRAAPARTDERLRRILADIPVSIGRSDLILLVTGSPGTASVIAQAIDESSLTEQEGTLAGDNTLLVLFADEPRLLAWRDRFDAIRSSAAPATPGVPAAPGAR